jgi:hypothetical protein
MSQVVQSEEDASFGRALAARTAALGSATSLGPPDLCYLHRRFDKSALGGALGGLLQGLSASPAPAAPAGELSGLYHHVIGLDASSPAPISTYIADLAAAEEPQALFSRGDWVCAGGTYCTWDAFARADLRVTVSIPGGVRTSLLVPDRKGGLVERPLTPDAWRRLALSALLRALCPPPALRCLRLLPPPLTPEEEPALLESARALLLEAVAGRSRGGAESGDTDAAEAARCSALTDMLAQLLWRCVGPHL